MKMTPRLPWKDVGFNFFVIEPAPCVCLSAFLNNNIDDLNVYYCLQ